MYYTLPIGTKIIFPNTEHNRTTLMGFGAVDGEDIEYDGFALETTYEIGGLDDWGKCFFWDGVGDRNYAGMETNGSSGVFEIVEAT